VKLSDLGTLVWENDKVALLVQEKPTEVCAYAIQKKEGKYYAPLGFILGSNSLTYKFKKD
jgi:hypothetical protein